LEVTISKKKSSYITKPRKKYVPPPPRFYECKAIFSCDDIPEEVRIEIDEHEYGDYSTHYSDHLIKINKAKFPNLHKWLAEHKQVLESDDNYYVGSLGT
jgi:hypothetical protein